MGSIFAEKALYGLDAAIINPANSGRALGLAFRGIRTASYDFMFGTVRLSAVQDRSRNKRRPHSTPATGTRYEDPNSSHLSRSARKYRSKDRLLVGRTGSPYFVFKDAGAEIVLASPKG